MVMAPEEPPRIELGVGPPRRWWLVIAVVVALVAAGVALGIWLASGDDDARVGPVGPEGPLGPQEPVGPGGDAIVGSGSIVSEMRDVSDFDAVAIAAVGNVVVRQTSAPSVAVRTDDNLLPLIVTEVRASTLTLDTAEGIGAIEPSDRVEVEIGMPNLAGLGISGVGSITVDQLVTDRLVISLAGVGSVEITGLDATTLVVDASGTGSIRVAGRVESQEVALAGTMTYDAAGLASTTGLVDSESIETAVVWVSDRLDVALRSLGSIHYYGRPDVTSSISGSGELRPLGDK